MTTERPTAASARRARAYDAISVETLVGERTPCGDSAYLGAVPCTPIYVYSWRARLGGILALTAVLVAGVYAFIR
ncbi:hypothetical protein BH09GEM1_BH09GEM1_07540 [soil metagenome]